MNWAEEQKVGLLAVGDVRDAADGIHFGKNTNQKISNWSHGKLRSYITYKALTAGITVQLAAPRQSDPATDLGPLQPFRSLGFPFPILQAASP